MGEYRSSTLVKTPQIKFTREKVQDVVDTYFVGVKLAHRKIGDNSIVFDIKLESAHADLFIGHKDETTKQWVADVVGPGSQVSLFGSYAEKTGKPNQIADKLAQVPDGTKIRMTFKGKKEGKNGREYNDFLVVDA